jgi:transcriptional regulator with GAF, ATPase, and Fis domain
MEPGSPRGNHPVQKDGQARPDSAESLTMEEVDPHIVAVLKAQGWKVCSTKGAAAVLGLKATTLEARMARLGITRPDR